MQGTGLGADFRWARRFAAIGVLLNVVLAHAQAQGQAPPGYPVDTIRLTLPEARARAVRLNPELQTARPDLDVARGEFRQAGLLSRSNPSLDLLTRGIGAEIGVSQELEIAGQRGARRTAARAGLERASVSITDVARTILGEVDRLFYRFAAADRQAILADEVLALNQRLLDVSQRKVQAGEISRLELNLATIELGRSQSRALAARRAREELGSELRRLLGLEPTAPIAPVIDSVVVPVSALSLDSLTAVATSRRPDLAARAAAVDQANAQVTVARREGFPNLVLRVASERLEVTGVRELRPGFGLTLPLFNRNQGEVQSRRAAALQAELARATLAARVRSEVSRALASYRSAAGETRVLETTVLTPARENRGLLEIAYREGKIGLPVLLLIRNQVIDAELDYWAAWLAEHEALANLAEATGETVVAFDPRGNR